MITLWNTLVADVSILVGVEAGVSKVVVGIDCATAAFFAPRYSESKAKKILILKINFIQKQINIRN
jgi:hypothetical protein